MSNWIEVDRAGLAQVIADRPKAFLLFELVQNALDEDVTQVTVKVEHDGHGTQRVTVTDDSPDGYQDIRHAWTLYAPSKKKADPELRGRFNVGCKMVLALATEARVISTKAAVEFTTDGRRNLRRRTEVGTVFEGVFRMSKAEAAAAVKELTRLIPPKGVRINVIHSGEATAGGIIIDHREPFITFQARLPTQFSDDEGTLRNTTRKTVVELFEPQAGEGPTLYEMGIPVVELDGDDPYHVNVMQRVPLNIDRDNVTPAYLRTIRVEVLNAAHDQLDEEQARTVWATEASEDERADAEAVDTVLTQRFGEKRVAYDPSDPEANLLAASKGYTVVSGGSLTGGQWANAKSGGSMKPAGQVTPSPSVKMSADGVPPLGGERITPVMQAIADFAELLAAELGVCDSLSIQWFGGREAARWPWAGAWGKGGHLSLNKPKLGRQLRAWEAGDRKPMVALLVHEFAHETESNHLAGGYHDELCRLAAHCLDLRWN